MAEAIPTTSPPIWDCASRPRRGLVGYHRVQDVGDAPGAPEALDAASARLHAARRHVRLAYVAVRRYPTDPRWGRIDGNPEARTEIELARLNLRMAHDHLRRAAAQRHHRPTTRPSALDEREVLEMGHRVMNGLQMIEGMLVRQARETDDRTARGVLELAAHRIRAMAAVQRMLDGARGDGVAGRDLGDHLRALCAEFAEAFLAGGRTALSVEAEAGLRAPPPEAAAVAMLVAELVINAAKHAFPDGALGRVAVRLTRHGPVGYRVVVEDTGPGLPPGFDPRASRGGLGMRIVVALARRLGATLEAERTAPGARFVVTVRG